MELCHFGAKVVFHRPSPSSPNRTFPCTSVSRTTRKHGHAHRPAAATQGAPLSNRGVAGLSTLKNITPHHRQRWRRSAFLAFPPPLHGLSLAGVNVVLVSQGSSEHAISIAVADGGRTRSEAALNQEFGAEQQLGRIELLVIESGFAIVALVGDGMRQQSGIAGRAFGTLGRNGVSIRAISQGSTERNISIVIDAKHERKALQAIHQAFFETEVKRLHIFCLGVGNVGGTMVDQVLAQCEDLSESADSTCASWIGQQPKMLIDPNGVTGDWRPTRRRHHGQLA